MSLPAAAPVSLVRTANSLNLREQVVAKRSLFGPFRRQVRSVAPHDLSTDSEASLSVASFFKRRRLRRKEATTVTIATNICPHGRQSRVVLGAGLLTRRIVCQCDPRSLPGTASPVMNGFDLRPESPGDADVSSVGAASVSTENLPMGPLHVAAMNGDQRTIRSMLFAKGVSVFADLPDADGVTPFMLAVLSAQFKCANLLLKAGAGLDATDKNGRTALHWIVYNGQHKALAWLIKRGADWRMADHGGRTILHWATDHHHALCLELLLKRVPASSINECDRQGMTPLMWAANHGHTVHVRLLLSRGADVSLRNSTGRSAAHFACCHADLPLIALLLRHNASCVLHQDDQGRTPLHLACVFGGSAVARLVMDACVRLQGDPRFITNLQCCDDQHRTPLHCAAVSGRADLVHELLLRGHDPQLIDGDGHMAIWYARVRQHHDVVTILAKGLVAQHRTQQAVLQRASIISTTESPSLDFCQPTK